MEQIYLDNAATSFPKPIEVLQSMVETYARIGVSPGRGSHDLAIEAEDAVERVRTQIASFFGAPDPDRVIFASNATDALNTAIQGLLLPGDHVVSTRLEHNSILRPLHHLADQGIITYDLVPFDGLGYVDPDAVVRAIRSTTRVVIVGHASNVLGTIQPVGAIGQRCAERGIPLIVDAAQSAGQVPIDMETLQISALAFTGHKSLFGPSGIGGLVLRPGLDLRTTRFGGTGVNSSSLEHTQAYPYRLEAGTLNLLGIIGLSLGLAYLAGKGMGSIHEHEMHLLMRLRDGLSEDSAIELYRAGDLSNHVPVLTANVAGVDPDDVGAILDGDFGIAVRVGVHCAPLVHEDLGTIGRGAVRFSPGFFNTEAEIDRAIEAMHAIPHRKGS